MYLGASCLEKRRVAISQINTNLYSVPRSFVNRQNGQIDDNNRPITKFEVVQKTAS
jgi:hypothetical protein